MPSEVILTDKIERWIQCILETESLPVELRTDLEMATCTDDSCEGPRTILFGLVRNVHDYMKNKEGERATCVIAILTFVNIIPRVFTGY